MPRVFFILLYLFTTKAQAQTTEPWVRFYDTVTEKAGYKDLKGRIRLPPRFEGLTRADSFYNIIAVNEEQDGKYKSFYLLKDGRQVGMDSVYSFDFTVDCESEGKIIFRDHKKDRVGFLDAQGKAIIPAVYNYVTPFRNGVAVAHFGAKRKCWEKDGDTTKCEHLGWEGGQSVLINDNNEILVDSLPDKINALNWYSKRTDNKAIDTAIYTCLNGRQGIHYCFVDYTKEFEQWFKRDFLQQLKAGGKVLSPSLSKSLTYWSSKAGWLTIPRQQYFKRFPNALSAGRFAPAPLREVTINRGMLNEMIFGGEDFRQYLDACGGHASDKFPFFTVTVTQYKLRQTPDRRYSTTFSQLHEEDYQEQFEFLRTEEGYKLVSLALKQNGDK